jgi:aminopeptidase N
MSAEQRLVTIPAFRPRLSAMLAIGALGLGLLATPTGTAFAEPVALTQTATSSRQAPDSLFPEVGSGRYDVKHYAISLTYRPSGKIKAKTTITAKTKKPLKSFSLDLEGLTVDTVQVNGHTADFSRRDNKLIIKPATVLDGRFSATITYHGKPVTHIDPDGAQDGWVPTKDGATVLSEPVGAMTWFPNNNTPRDKATFDMKITVPSKLEVAGSGDLRSVRKHKGQETWRWLQPYQQATYLAMISIGNYDVYHSTMITTTGRTLPIWSFIEPKFGKLEDQRALIPKIIRFEERKFGPYPFNSAGIVVKDTKVGYALETQNRPVFDEAPDDLTNVHEWAHQWYGNSVSLSDWGDIWLNEGFATYAEWLWDAAHGGPSTAAKFQQEYDDHPANPPKNNLWSPAPAALTDPADLFGPWGYLRGSMTLEALRQTVGSHDFFVILRKWAQQNEYGNVSTPEFIALSERVSGQDLDAFFKAWLYVAEKPALN